MKEKEKSTIKDSCMAYQPPRGAKVAEVERKWKQGLGCRANRERDREIAREEGSFGGYSGHEWCMGEIGRSRVTVGHG